MKDRVNILNETKESESMDEIFKAIGDNLIQLMEIMESGSLTLECEDIIDNIC